MSNDVLQVAAHQALANVIDPEIRRPITELGMVDQLEVDETGTVHLTVLLTVASCPLRNTIESDVRKALGSVEGITGINLTIGAMFA